MCISYSIHRDYRRDYRKELVLFVKLYYKVLLRNETYFAVTRSKCAYSLKSKTLIYSSVGADVTDLESSKCCSLYIQVHIYYRVVPNFIQKKTFPAEHRFLLKETKNNTFFHKNLFYAENS